jgi:hypothetical protein
LIEAERAWDFQAPDFDPFRERRVRQHVGDYALFMTGLFRERRAPGGRRLLHPAGRRAPGRRRLRALGARPEARLFAALAAGFERCAAPRLSQALTSAPVTPRRRSSPCCGPDAMVASALEALVGGEPAGETVEAR